MTYRDVFVEYFKTMNLIERGEALTYENYSRLADNYVYNIKNFIKLGNSYISKYNLEDSKMYDSLNNYFVALIDALNYLDYENNVVNKLQVARARSVIRDREMDFMNEVHSYIR
ncbi:hypothetical protein FD03_GL001874 [Companilactobacillus nodensis DSM 19682 = JCM 14932 = NBRC 107160]|uniref:Uncharacterized protein n=1 Tax=Companilactobacillus nodensis DSM 19682 = JCM 14932 = NBRC 107160 TaxID=1423775 RepID=A0A0R1KFZ9_9LACO|nr:hypothetical protein FD03_GL001874 [Companilactobacillus nodensis DSM 19682 = JCM 14932 = NBRC 107160]